ncbi:hypothetical protein RhiirC2_802093, partial [Rhizophagus irregularis]
GFAKNFIYNFYLRPRATYFIIYSNNEDLIMYNTDEEYAHGKSSTTGMIHETILETKRQK